MVRVGACVFVKFVWALTVNLAVIGTAFDSRDSLADARPSPNDYLTEEQLSSFQRNGYLLIENYFAEKELNDYTASLRRMIRSFLRKAAKTHSWLRPDDYRGDEFDAGLIALEKADHAYVASIYDSIPSLPAFQRIVSKYETQEAINQLLGRDADNALNSYTARTLIQPPGDERRTYEWHQEVFYTTPRAQFIQTWAPLIRDVSNEDGAIWMLPRSHKQVHNSTWVQPQGRALQISIDDSVISQYVPWNTRARS